MKNMKIKNINFGKIEKIIEQYENQWIAVSDKNEVIANGNTYKETVGKSGNRRDIVLFKVPSLNVSLAP